MKHPAIKQYSYHKWGNDRVFEHLKSLPGDVFNNEIKSVFSSIQEVIIHAYLAEGMWFSVMSGDDFADTMDVIKELKEESSGGNLLELQQLYAEMNEKYFDFLNNHDELDQNITIIHPSYGNLDASVTDMVNHVVNHGTYHRGNIAAMLRQQDHAGVSTDYLFFLYDLI